MACKSNKNWCVSPVVSFALSNNAGFPSGIPDLGRVSISILNFQACKMENGEPINRQSGQQSIIAKKKTPDSDLY